jgi:CelD/BcsL family acetyltransferase involved in cellulose biosynthesis
MTVEVIADAGGFEKIRSAYEEVYASDPHRNVFVSWPWLAAYFNVAQSRWMVLAARDPDGRYRAFMPLELFETRVSRIAVDRELHLAANPIGDYNGLIATPDADCALKLFSSYIDGLAWDNFWANNVRDPRVARVINGLAVKNRVVRHDDNPCLFVQFPESWEAYLHALTGKSGQSVRHAMRGLRRLGEIRLEEAGPETIDDAIETLLHLNHLRWRTNLPKARRTKGRLFRSAFDRGCCRLVVLRCGERALAAHAAFVDPERRSWGSYMTSFNPEFARYSPGIAARAMIMQTAIEQGFTEFDFLRGDEPYKLKFAPEGRWLHNWSVHRNGVRNRVVNAGRRGYHFAKQHARRILLGKESL